MSDASFTPLRERRVTLVSPSELPPLPMPPPPKTAKEMAEWRRRVREAFAVVESDPAFRFGTTPPVSMMTDPYPAMEFIVRSYEAATGRKLLV